MHKYASFGTPSKYTSPEFRITEQYMYQLGYQWRKKGIKKLPQSVSLPGRPLPFPIVRSSHEWAKAFVKGWKNKPL